MRSWRAQGTRYVIVGLASNLVLYLVYLLITALGLRYKIAMTLVYLLSAAQTFVLNALWTFEHRLAKKSLVKYALSYVACYIVNMAALVFFVDRIGLPHQAVQGAMIVVIAVIMFFLQKFWVFRSPKIA